MRACRYDVTMKNNENPGLILGIDIGGTNTAYGIVDACGKIVCRGSIPTQGEESFYDFALRLREDVTESMRQTGGIPDAVVAIGVGAPCVDSEKGTIEGAVNLPWPSPIPLAATLREVFGLPAAAENDANAAAIGEMEFGCARGVDNFIMLTLGTGVGSAIICDGRLLKGKRGLAGELGHVPVRKGPEARMCNCGRPGCLDAYVSARGITNTARELLEASDTPSVLRGTEALTPKVIAEAAAAGDQIGIRTMDFTGEILGEACADFTAFSSPEAFVFFGGIARAFPIFRKPLEKAFNKNLLWVFDGQVRFFQSSLPETEAAILGAAAVGRRAIKTNSQPITP